MPRKAMPLTAIPEGFVLTEKTIEFVSERYPTVDIEKTLERFGESALAHGRMYSDWQAAFRTWVRRAVEEKWDGVVFKLGRGQDPKWAPILALCRQYGFPDIEKYPTPGSLRTAFDQWNTTQKRSTAPLNFGQHLKAV